MTKKELLRRLLQKLEPHRDLAGGLLVLVEQETDTSELITTLLQAIHQAMKNVQHTTANTHLQKTVRILEKLRAQEAKESYSDEDLEDLLTTV